MSNNFDSQKIANDLLGDLSSRSEDVIRRRFGLETDQETLASIGQDYGVTRERIRQIEEGALSELKSKGVPQLVQEHFKQEVKKFGELRREDKLLYHLDQEYPNQVNFLLTLGDGFERKKEDQELHTLWTINRDSISLARKNLNSLINHFDKKRDLLSFDQIVEKRHDILPQPVEEPALMSFVEVSKKIEQSPTGELGLKDWPEVKPRGVRDRAFLVLRKEQEPKHFNKVTELINQHFPKKKNGEVVKALPQTVHNELIKDDRFVLVGRGIYALKDWGYKTGTVKEIIAETLEESGPMSRDQLVEEVLDQRMVKRNTVLLNLQNNDRFQKNEEGKYTLIKAETA